jgi:hypothetical protein
MYLKQTIPRSSFLSFFDDFRYAGARIVALCSQGLNTAQTAVKTLLNHRTVFEKFPRAKFCFSRVDNPPPFFISIHYKNFNVSCSPPIKAPCYVPYLSAFFLKLSTFAPNSCFLSSVANSCGS